MYNRRNHYSHRYEPSAASRRFVSSSQRRHESSHQSRHKSSQLASSHTDTDQTWLVVDEYDSDNDPVKHSKISQKPLNNSSTQLSDISKVLESSDVYVIGEDACKSPLSDSVVSSNNVPKLVETTEKGVSKEVGSSGVTGSGVEVEARLSQEVSGFTKTSCSEGGNKLGDVNASPSDSSIHVFPTPTDLYFNKEDPKPPKSLPLEEKSAHADGVLLSAEKSFDGNCSASFNHISSDVEGPSSGEKHPQNPQESSHPARSSVMDGKSRGSSVSVNSPEKSKSSRMQSSSAHRNGHKGRRQEKDKREDERRSQTRREGDSKRTDSHTSKKTYEDRRHKTTDSGKSEGKSHRKGSRAGSKRSASNEADHVEKRSRSAEPGDALSSHVNPWLMEDEEDAPSASVPVAPSFKDMSSMYVDASFEGVGDAKLDLRSQDSYLEVARDSKSRSSQKAKDACPVCCRKVRECYCDPYPEPSYSASALQDVQLRPFRAQHDGLWACPLVACQVTSPERSDLSRHVAETHKGFQIAFLCEYCDTLLPNRKAYGAHVQDRHPSRFTSFNFNLSWACLVTMEQFGDLLENDCSGGFRCKTQGCPEEFPSRHALYCHRKDVHPETCSECNEKFCDEITLEEHKLVKHECSFTSLCSSPLISYMSMLAPQDDMDAKAGEISMVAMDPEDLKGENKFPMSTSHGKMKCLRLNGQCGEVFNNGIELYVHFVEAHKTRFVCYSCSFCDKSFFKLDLLMWHVKQSHSEETLKFLMTFGGPTVGPMHGIYQPNSAYPCLYPRCPAVFKSTDMFRKHVIAAHGYLCHRCFESFSSRDLLEIHAKEKQHGHTCCNCRARKMYPSKLLLLEHCNRNHRFVPKPPASVLDPLAAKISRNPLDLFSYNSQGSLVCKIGNCFRSYNQSQPMYHHLVVAHHVEATAYSCPFCEKVYAARFLVLWHVKQDHGARAVTFRMEMSREVFGPVVEIVPMDASYVCLFVGCNEVFSSYHEMRGHTSLQHKNNNL